MIPEKAEEVVETAKEAPEAEETAAAEPPYPASPLVDIPYDPDFSEEDFSASVNELKAEDIKMPEDNKANKEGKKKPSKSSNAVLTGLLVVCVSVAVVCLFMLGKNIWGKIKGQAIYSGTEFEGFTLDDDPTDQRTLAKTGADVPLLSLFDRINAGENAALENTTGQYSEQLAQMKASLSALKAQNDDVSSKHLDFVDREQSFANAAADFEIFAQSKGYKFAQPVIKRIFSAISAGFPSFIASSF